MVKKAKKRQLAFLISFVVFFSQISFASSLPYIPPPQSENQQTTNTSNPTNRDIHEDANGVLPPGNYSRAYLDEQSEESAHAYLQNNEQILDQVLYLANKLQEEKNNLIQTRGEKAVSELIAAAQVIYKEPGLGKADYRVIKGDKGAPNVVITRVVLDKTERAYLLIDQNQAPKGFYFRQYVARQLIESGFRQQRDTNGSVRINIFGRQKMRYGRDTDLLIFNDNILRSAQSRRKPKPTEWNWWRQYFLSKFNRPDKATVTGAFVFGALPHTLETAGMAHHMHTSYLPADWNFFYSMLIGAYISTYKAWTNFGTSKVRILKLMANAMIYATTLVVLMKPGSVEEKLAAVNIVNMTSILANVGMNSVARNKWNQISKIGDEARDNTGQWKIPFTNVQTWWKKSHAKNQLLYLLPWTINLVGIFILGSTHMFQIPHTGVTVPVLQFAGMPVAMIWSALYARRLARRAKHDPALAAHYEDLNKMAQQYEGEWERWVPLPMQIGTSILYRSAWHKVRPAWRSVQRTYSRCADLLTK